jgi:hypothetical protein
MKNKIESSNEYMGRLDLEGVTLCSGCGFWKLLKMTKREELKSRTSFKNFTLDVQMPVHLLKKEVYFGNRILSISSKKAWLAKQTQHKEVSHLN